MGVQLIDRGWHGCVIGNWWSEVSNRQLVSLYSFSAALSKLVVHAPPHKVVPRKSSLLVLAAADGLEHSPIVLSPCSPNGSRLETHQRHLSSRATDASEVSAEVAVVVEDLDPDGAGVFSGEEGVNRSGGIPLGGLLAIVAVNEPAPGLPEAVLEGAGPADGIKQGRLLTAEEQPPLQLNQPALHQLPGLVSLRARTRRLPRHVLHTLPEPDRPLLVVLHVRCNHPQPVARRQRKTCRHSAARLVRVRGLRQCQDQRPAPQNTVSQTIQISVEIIHTLAWVKDATHSAAVVCALH
ncbi:hypothetical protein PCANC_19692 [Puccinia coronata f. sp. avenae]|uniref:Uncharacterized protein n=1 Tax=Puccinia coronata f. sp. avenae TaxID=200324 RepID=A0A2N5SAY3_9BASI|nr:hypothetical protein PCANC_19692 [Puccinia coronata f. sp. avenae]